MPFIEEWEITSIVGMVSGAIYEWYDAGNKILTF